MKNKFILLALFFWSCNPSKELPIECPVVIEPQEHQISDSKVSGITTIPVVVHIVWNKPEQNLSDAQIRSQIDQLNSDFRGNVVGAVFPYGDCQIEFCLASIDPQGNPTNGITREFTNITPFSDYVSMKTTTWDMSKYLNIWVCKTAGYNGHGGFSVGVIANYFGFGKTTYIPKPALTTHEVGHFLGLAHIWGGNTVSCLDSDGIEDTPNQDFRYWQCDLNRASCGVKNNTQNFMQNGYDHCMIMFTPGQCAAMQAKAQRFATSNGCGMNPPIPVEVGYSTDSLNFKTLENAIFPAGTYFIKFPGDAYLMKDLVKVPGFFPTKSFRMNFTKGKYLLIVISQNKVYQFNVQ